MRTRHLSSVSSARKFFMKQEKGGRMDNQDSRGGFKRRPKPPFCEHFGVCGGCASQDIPYEVQLQTKKLHIEQAFKDCGIHAPIYNVLPSPKTQFYRNRMDVVVWPNQHLGLRKKGKWHDVIDIKKCWLLSEGSNDIIRVIREFIKEYSLTIYDQRSRQGLMRYVVIRESKHTGSIKRMVILITSPGQIPRVDILSSRLVPLGVVSIYQSITDALADTSTGMPSLIAGDPYLIEILQGKRFSYTPNCFFQTNPYQADRLFGYVKEQVVSIAPQSALELYCGVGVMAVILSDVIESITAIEVVPESIEMARHNLKQNNVQNVTLIEGDVDSVINQAKADYDLIIVDPPRGGLSKSCRRAIQEMRPKHVIYVSCNPVSLAQDLQKLNGFYEIITIQPFDLFPHTPHVECVAMLQLKV